MKREYMTGQIVVHWDDQLCIHVGECVKELPQVFRPREQPWVQIDAAPAEEIIRVIDLCPSGALTYSLPEGSEVDPALAGGPGSKGRAHQPAVNIKAMPDGALVVEGPFVLTGPDGTSLPTGRRTALCRCGHSRNKPFCDGKHKSVELRPLPAEIILEIIRKRRSIRKFKSTPLPDQMLEDILEAARLAPSGCNAQPWRFKLVKDEETKKRLEGAAYNQKFIAQAPVVIVCCADLEGYVQGTFAGLEALEEMKAIESRIKDTLSGNLKQAMRDTTGSIIKEQGPRLAANVAIAVEHMVLAATAYGLGSCWVRLFEEKKIREIMGWNEQKFVVALLPLGYPDEEPGARPRLAVEDILL